MIQTERSVRHFDADARGFPRPVGRADLDKDTGAIPAPEAQLERRRATRA